eukprot:TRINITY_DN10984_c0_g1_i1.p1 TRINITY_DN10984_c0_g1~~TRINITY_DN10984_c0_g1_i1.p1  ORF type:complete len:192 (+),score=47.59 TRINITY_DN10984_c0_g1_i1:18-593(+)
MVLHRIYMKFLEKYPIQTKMFTASFLMGAGDTIAQFIEDEKVFQTGNYDYSRTARMMMIGLTFFGPALHYWYGFLNRLIPGSGAAKAVLKVGIDQTIFAPLAIGVFYTLNGLFSFESPTEIIDTLKNDYMGTLLINYMIWPVTQLINFKYIPPHSQVLFSNFIALGWNTCLSLMANKEDDDEIKIVKILKK